MEKAKKSVTPASFVCEKCKGIPSMDQIVESVATYGLIWLNNDENTWLGFNCPLCEKPSTNIKKFKNEDINPFRLELENRISDVGILVYHSFPFSFHHPLKDPVKEYKYMQLFELRYEHEDRERAYKYRPMDTTLKQLYCSYSFGSKSLEPAIAIWWYGDKDIEELSSYESESGLRAFPRYRVYHYIYKKIDMFCRRERLQLDFQKESYLDWKITHKLPNSTKKDLTKTFDFMHILDMPFYENIPAYVKREVEFLLASGGWPKLHRERMDINFDVYGIRNFRIDYEKISSVVWANFTKDYFQKLLKQLSEKFIDEYITLSKRVDFSYKAVWGLKEKYLSDLVEAIKSPLELHKLEQSVNKYRRDRIREAEKCFPGVEIISQNFEIDQLKIWIADTLKDITGREAFLLIGERGTGKSLFAKAIHEASGRKGEFVTFDCGNKVPTLFPSELFGYVKGAHSEAKSDHKGYLEKAENGTIFIDEVGNLPMSLQSAMLGFLQDRKFQPVGSTETKYVNAIVVLATNMDLRTEVENGKFRADLYDRICAFENEIPPLRNRKDDIPILIYHFIKRHDRKRLKDPSLEEYTTTPDFMKVLTDYHWPGNARELENVVYRIVSDKSKVNNRSPIDVNDMPGWFSRNLKSKDQALPKSNEPSHPIERRYFHLPEDSVLIELKKQGMKNREIAERFKVAPETVSRRLSKIAKSQN